MNRYIFIVFNIVIFCQLLGWSFGVVKLIKTGPKYPPTKGQVWPAPQQELKLETFFKLRPSNLHVTVPHYSCDLLTAAVKRYKLILRDLELFLRPKYNKHYYGHNEKPEFLKELQIELNSECEKTPHYEMKENYRLKIGKISVLTSGSIWGILRGLETFVQLFYFTDDMREIHINATTIDDFPAYKHRGLLIDTGRHYLSLSIIYKILDALAMNKMNVLHWHIVDDQSFPYQSERYPALSKKGAFSPTMVYTKADIRSVVAFARDRGIRVVPEIDVPGHTRSWGEAMPQVLTKCYKHEKDQPGLGPLDPTKNETYDLLLHLFDEVHRWLPDEFLHIGGDEVQVQCWNSNPQIREFLKKNNMTVGQLQGYFMKTTLPLLPKKTRPIVWQEAFDMKALPNRKTHVQVWKYKWIQEMDKILNAGHYVIFSAAWYLDTYLHLTWEQFYQADPRQMMYRLRQNSSELGDIVGGEACMWGEMVDDTNILSNTWPRASAIAERLWTGTDYKNGQNISVTDTDRSRLEEHACRMNRRGIPAEPPNGPGFCVGSPPPMQKTYEVHVV